MGIRIFVALILSLLAVSGPSLADNDICSGLSNQLAQQSAKFPKLDETTIREISLWRESGCERPPTGKGNITKLCTATTADGTVILYWVKRYKSTFKANFITCQGE